MTIIASTTHHAPRTTPQQPTHCQRSQPAQFVRDVPWHPGQPSIRLQSSRLCMPDARLEQSSSRVSICVTDCPLTGDSVGLQAGGDSDKARQSPTIRLDFVAALPR